MKCFILRATPYLWHAADEDPQEWIRTREKGDWDARFAFWEATFPQTRNYSACACGEEDFSWTVASCLTISRAPSPDQKKKKWFHPSPGCYTKESIEVRRPGQSWLFEEQLHHQTTLLKKLYHKNLEHNLEAAPPQSPPAPVTTYVTSGRPCESCDFPNFLSL